MSPPPVPVTRAALRPGAAWLLMLAAGAAAAGSVQVEIDAAQAAGEPFLVRVTGHYADLHLGRSRHWKDALVPAGEPARVDVGAVNPITSMGVSVLVYHPAYVYASARSKRTPLPVVPVSFPVFQPRTWQAIETSGGAFENGGPEQTLAQVVGHLQLFVAPYLAAVDRTPPPLSPTEASLGGYLEVLERLVHMVDHVEPRSTAATLAGKDQANAAAARHAAGRELEQRALARELLRRARAWVALPRAERVTVRRLMAAMRYPRTVGEELMTSSDLERLGDFLDRHAAARSERRKSDPAVSWTNPDNRVSYRFRTLDPPGECAYVSITVDLTTVVDADLGDMSNTVRASFCRADTGAWAYRRP